MSQNIRSGLGLLVLAALGWVVMVIGAASRAGDIGGFLYVAGFAAFVVLGALGLVWVAVGLVRLRSASSEL